MNTDETQNLSSGDLEEVSASAPGSKSLRKPSPLPPGRLRGRRGRRVVVALSVVVFIGAVVLAVMSQAAQANAEARAAELAQRNRAMQDALELHRTGQLELGNKLDACEEERDEIEISSNDQVDQLSSELAACQANRSELEGQASELALLAKRFDKMVSSGDLKIRIRRGQMIVQLPSAVLFPSGSAKLSPRGEKTMKRVSSILKTMENRRFTVAGHTDNVPVGPEVPFASNWELSTARAVEVTQALVREGVPPSTLVAAGYGEHAPIATNRSKRGRRSNRRIEIILEPDLDKVKRELFSSRKSK